MRKKDFWLIITAVVAALALAIGQFASAAITTGAWGLSFPSAGSAPNGPASREQLREYDAVYVGNPEEKVLYLTFDAGYENGHTAAILDTLKNHNVKAAFFLVGNYLQKNADLVRQMVDEGHIVGNHTMTHPDMSAITDKTAFEKEGYITVEDNCIYTRGGYDYLVYKSTDATGKINMQFATAEISDDYLIMLIYITPVDSAVPDVTGVINDR